MHRSPLLRRPLPFPAQRIEDRHRFSTLAFCHVLIHPIALPPPLSSVAPRPDPCFKPRLPCRGRRHRARLCPISIVETGSVSGPRAETSHRGFIHAALRNRAHRTERRHATAGRADRRRHRHRTGNRRRGGQEARVLGPARPVLPDQEEPQGPLPAARPRRQADIHHGNGAQARPERRRAALHDDPRRGDRGSPVRHPVPQIR